MFASCDHRKILRDKVAILHKKLKIYEKMSISGDSVGVEWWELFSCADMCLTKSVLVAFIAYNCDKLAE